MATDSIMEFTNRSAIVTGGAGGLGGATVRHLAGLGIGVAIFDRDAARAQALASELGPELPLCRGTSTRILR